MKSKACVIAWLALHFLAVGILAGIVQHKRVQPESYCFRNEQVRRYDHSFYASANLLILLS